MQKLSIIIVTKNSASFIPECVNSILSQHTSFPVEVIVVDNASTDGIIELLEHRYPQISIIKNVDNRGFDAANNQAIRSSSGNIILLLNPDTRLEPGALEALVQYIFHREDVAAVGPKILNADGTLQRTGVSFPSLWNTFVEIFFLDLLFPRSRVFGRHRRLYEDPDAAYEVDYVQGSCLLLKRNALEEVGFLDEDYFMYFDEADLCCRLKRRGWRVMYVPHAVITHYGASGATYYDETRLGHFYRSYLLFLKKHYRPLRQAMFRALLFCRALVRVVVFTCGAHLITQRRDEFLKRSEAYRSLASLLLKSG